MTKFVLLTALICCAGLSEAQQQYFRIHPDDVEVGEGGIAVIHCAVENRAGRVQWTKDGLTLGYSRSIPGIPRYQVLGTDNSGEFSLQISNVTLEDDADYECQVGPANYNKPIRHSAHLHVLLAPTSIEIVGQRAGSRIDIRENEEVEITCKVANAKPKAHIIWYRKDSRFVTDSQVDTEEDGTMDGRKTVTSVVKFRPTARDNGATFACEAQHPALMNNPMRVTVVLSVMYPPGPPEIQGYIEGETIRMGQTVSLTCVSHGGNPLAQIVWFRNEEPIDYSYTTSGRESRNMYTFVASSEDNNAKYRCEAKNQMSVEAMTAEIVVAVQFAPDKVTIDGPSEAKVGDILEFKCETSNSNPPATVQWVVDGRTVAENFTHTATSPNGGWITKSDLTVTIGSNDRNKMVSCYAVNQELGETIVESHMISVLYPPGSPNITGLSSDSWLEEGQLKRLTCISMAGNPLADLKWFRGDVELTTVTVKGDGGDYSKADLLVTANRTDNGPAYRCEASNPATDTPLETRTYLKVLFKPESVKISVDPDVPKAGKKAVLTCESGSSNPTANITWRYKDKVLAGVDTDVRPGEYGGNVTINILEIEVKPEDDGEVFICEAINSELQESVHNAKTLSVKFKPQFSVDSDEGLPVYPVQEGGNLLINLTAKANPGDIEFKWTRAGSNGATIPNLADALPESRLIALPGGHLNITDARREDAGKYKVKATNSEGKATVKFILDVQYEPKISEITSHIMVSSGENAEMVCVVDANPIKEDTIQWKREGFDMASRTKVANVSTNFYLTVLNVTAEDAGEFTCVVDNGIGKPAKNSTFLLVRHKPKIDKSPAIAKSASDKGHVGQLVCRAQGAPSISFTWSRLGQVIKNTEDEETSDDDENGDKAKYEVNSEMIDRLTYQSTLSVRNVTSSDYGSYDCIAQNEMGLERYSIYLNVTSRPDPPAYLTILNVTYNSINLTWTPGFDGGFPQTFNIRYRKEGAENYQYVDVAPSGATTYEVQDLKMETKYYFSILAFNSQGSSVYTKEFVINTKSSEPWIGGENGNGIEETFSRGIILVITLVAALLLVLNVVLISCYVRRRARKHLMGGSSTASTKSATIEMYVGSSYNDTMSGETLSSISEKSGSYISSGEHDGHHHHGHHHHHHHHHRHHAQAPPHVHTQPPTHVHDEEFEEDEDLTRHTVAVTGTTAPQSTYLVDHHPHVYDTRDPNATTNYATMPRRPNPSAFVHDQTQHYNDELRRQAYIQSLDDQFESNSVSSTMLRRQHQQKVFQSDDDHATYYHGGEMYNGLYVPPAHVDPDYGYLPPLPPPPRPPMPRGYSSTPSPAVNVYPENVGHLV